MGGTSSMPGEGPCRRPSAGTATGDRRSFSERIDRPQEDHGTGAGGHCLPAPERADGASLPEPEPSCRGDSACGRDTACGRAGEDGRDRLPSLCPAHTIRLRGQEQGDTRPGGVRTRSPVQPSLRDEPPKARGQGCRGGSPRGAGVSAGVFLLRPQLGRQPPWEAQLGRAGRSQAGGARGSLKQGRGPSSLPLLARPGEGKPAGAGEQRGRSVCVTGSVPLSPKQASGAKFKLRKVFRSGTVA